MKRFRLVSCARWTCGCLPNNHQVVLGVSCPEVVALIFDADGTFLASRTRAWGEEVAAIAGQAPPYRIFSTAFDEAVGPIIQAWAEEMQMTPGPVVLQEFFDEDREIGLARFPVHLHPGEIRDAPEDDRAQLLAEREEWTTRGAAVLTWGNDYWLDAEGQVESS